MGHPTSPPGGSPGSKITPSGPPVRKTTRSKLFISVRFYQAIALIKLVFGPLGPVIYPLLKRRKALAPPCLVLPQSSVPRPQRAAGRRLALANWGLHPPQGLGRHAAQRHRLYQLSAGQQSRLNGKPGSVLVIETML